MKLSKVRLEYLLNKYGDNLLSTGQQLLAGELVEFGQADNKALRAAVNLHHKQGQEALEGFVQWLVRHRGHTLATARRHAGRVWDAYCFEYDEESGKAYPWKLLDRHDDYSYSMRNAYRTALRYYATYTEDTELAMELHTVRSRWSFSRVRSPKKPLTGPYCEEDLQALLKANTKLKGNPRYPWAYAVGRILLLTGISLIDLVHVSRKHLEDAKANGLLEVWSRSKRMQKIPWELIEEEVIYLLNLPWQWEDLADLVAPEIGANKRRTVAKKRISERMKEVYNLAKVARSSNWLTILRRTAAVRYYTETNNLVGAGQILGLSDLSSVKDQLERMPIVD